MLRAQRGSDAAWRGGSGELLGVAWDRHGAAICRAGSPVKKQPFLGHGRNHPSRRGGIERGCESDPRPAAAGVPPPSTLRRSAGIRLCRTARTWPAPSPAPVGRSCGPPSPSPGTPEGAGPAELLGTGTAGPDSETASALGRSRPTVDRTFIARRAGPAAPPTSRLPRRAGWTSGPGVPHCAIGPYAPGRSRLMGAREGL